VPAASKVCSGKAATYTQFVSCSGTEQDAILIVVLTPVECDPPSLCQSAATSR